MKFALGLGSNQGDRLLNLREGVAQIKQQTRLISVSAIYESQAMLPTNSPTSWNEPFFNLCVLVESDKNPIDLLSEFKKIEERLGRNIESRQRWAPRELDIDILASEDSFSSEHLEIPHRGLRGRPFALLPLADVWPKWRTPWNLSATDAASEWRWSSQVPFDTKRTSLSLTKIMSIINVTPDSFSADGILSSSSDALKMRLESDLSSGATILDFGAESTRPGGTSLTPDEEWSRLQPIFQSALAKLRRTSEIYFEVSLDSRHPQTIHRALEYGIDWINDVEGFKNPDMIELAAGSGKKVMAMHSLTVPVQKSITLPDAEDPVNAILEWGFEKIAVLTAAGVRLENIVLDPGIGFGKTLKQNIYLLQNVCRLHQWGVPVLVGHSRKSFMNDLTKRVPGDRDLETAVISAELARAGVEYLRVHNTELTARALAASTYFGSSK